MKTGTRARLRQLFVTVSTTAALSACGGGGSPSPAPTASGSPTAPTPVPAPAPAPAPGSASAPQIPYAQMPTAADCPRVLSDSVAAAALKLDTPEKQQLATLLQATSPDHGYPLFVRLPDLFTAWVDYGVYWSGKIDMDSVSLAVHETDHNIKTALTYTCASSGGDKYFFDGVVYVTDLRYGDTDNYSIAGEAIPDSFKTYFRYKTYIDGAKSANGNDFRVLLDELNAYTGAAQFELGLLSNASYTSLRSPGNIDIGGMIDFMMFMPSYLKAARLNHPTTYAHLQAQPNTLAYIQKVWTAAEAVVAGAYPYTTLAGSSAGVDLNKPSLALAYSPDLLSELDALGIKHLPGTTWNSTYLKP